MTQVLERCAGYQRLRAQYADRLGAARAAAAAGHRVIGRIGHTTPVEPILAAGCTPVTLAADLQRATPRADLHIDPELPAETRALCEAALAGDYECLQLLILTRLHDKLYYFLKELHRIGRAPHLPPFTIHDLMHSRRDAVQAYNRDRFQALLKRLGREAVRPIDHASLTEAIGLTNSVRGLWRRLDAMRREGRIRGTQAMQVIGAGLVMHPAAYAPALQACVDTLASAPPAQAPSAARVVLASSEPLQHLALHDAVECAGGFVVSEDDPWGARAGGDDIAVDADPFEAVLDKLWRDTPSSGVWPPAEREAWLRAEATRPAVDAVVLHVPPSDRLLGWDVPRLSRTLEGAGRAVVTVHHDVHTAEGRTAIVRDLAAFFDRLGKRGSQEIDR